MNIGKSTGGPRGTCLERLVARWRAATLRSAQQAVVAELTLARRAALLGIVRPGRLLSTQRTAVTPSATMQIVMATMAPRYGPAAGRVARYCPEHLRGWKPTPGDTPGHQVPRGGRAEVRRGLGVAVRASASRYVLEAPSRSDCTSRPMRTTGAEGLRQDLRVCARRNVSGGHGLVGRRGDELCGSATWSAMVSTVPPGDSAVSAVVCRMFTRGFAAVDVRP